MRSSQTMGVLLSVALLAASANLIAQDKRYMNFHHATHISGGWVAFDNGSLYACQFGEEASQQAPQCVEASGLPSSLQSVSALWGEANTAWVAYTDGRVYGCRYPADGNGMKPRCKAADGLP